MENIIDQRMKRRASESARTGDFLDALLDHSEVGGTEELEHREIRLILMVLISPTEFEPERFVSSDFDFRGNQSSFIPFGAGPRICPGVSLGVRMMNLLLATLLHNFDWKLPNGMAAQDMDMKDNFGVTLQKADPLVAIAVKATV